jgi:cytochrome c oxidase subunit I
MSAQVPQGFARRVAALPAGQRYLLAAWTGAALAALFLGVAFGLFTAWARFGLAGADAESGYRMLTLHGVTAFFYWLYFAQGAVLLAVSAAFASDEPRLSLAPLGAVAFALMLAGLAANMAAILGGPPLLYNAPPELADDSSRASAGLFYAGYLLLGAGLVVMALPALATGLRAKSRGHDWSVPGFAAAAWAGLLMVSGIAAFGAFLGPALWTWGLGAMPADTETRWHVLFHNLHYLPLMGAALVWYVLVAELTGVRSIFGDAFSKRVWAIYLLFVPPTSLYHMFLDPGLTPSVRALGSLLSLFISVPTVAVFLILVASLEADGRARGALGVFGWLRLLPWREPGMSAIAMAIVNLALGGAFAFVLIQEKLAPLLSDTFFVPAYFHFLTVGAVSLSLLAALGRVIVGLTGRPLPAARLLTGLPYLVTAGLVLFGGAGMWAGLMGMPRRVMAVDYDGAAPAAWAVLSPLIGIGGAVMAAGVLAYAAVLLAALPWRLGRAGADMAMPGGATRAISGTPTGPAWAAPIFVGALVAAMFLATAAAFILMRGLPLLGAGGGH